MKTLAIALCTLTACGDSMTAEPEDADRQGGDTTVDDRTRDAFTHPAQNMSMAQRSLFQAGRGPFDFHWHVPELGPLFNNDACFGCHGSNGRGLSKIGNGELQSQGLIRDQPAGRHARGARR